LTLQHETSKVKDRIVKLDRKIISITQYQRPYIANLLRKMAQRSPHNANIICEYIIAEQNEINIKESTKEGKIKCLVGLSTYLNHKSFQDISKSDVLDYLTSLKKPVTADQIRTKREPRLMIKMDTLESLPQIFRDNSLFLLPLSIKEYVIVKGKGYHSLESIESKTIIYNTDKLFPISSSDVESESKYLTRLIVV